jgi:hypothetical protein
MKSQSVLCVSSILLFLIGLSIFFETVGPQLKWTHTLAGEQVSQILFDLRSQNAINESFNSDREWNFVAEASQPLQEKFAIAYNSTLIHGILVMLISLVLFGLFIVSVRNKGK